MTKKEVQEAEIVEQKTVWPEDGETVGDEQVVLEKNDDGEVVGWHKESK